MQNTHATYNLINMVRKQQKTTPADPVEMSPRPTTGQLTTKKKGKKRRHPDDFYEMRTSMSESEIGSLSQEINEHTEKLRQLKKRLRGAKPRMLLKADRLREIRRQSAERLAPYRYKKKHLSVKQVEQEEQEAGLGEERHGSV